ncbi:hypothetical protein JCM6882_002727 [Rhodosporidiobolus microsporus]
MRPSAAPCASTSSLAASTSHGSGSSSASSSTKSSPLLPHPMARRDSTYSLYSSSSSSDYDTEYTSDEEDDDELATPDCSPELKAADASSNRSGKGKGKAPVDLTASFHAFSLSGIDEEDSWEVPVAPVAPPTSTLSSTSPSPSLPPPAALPLVPSAVFQQQSLPAPAIEPEPAAALHESPDPAHRGRSRWPRLLWRSELDPDSLAVLKSYHERAIGAPLPRLRRGMRDESVGRWSRRMEDAGL